MERVVIHIDMDAFFASVEQRDNPGLKGKPVVIGADPKGGKGRGVVSTCSYEARRFGIRSAMPISEAYRRCPEAVFMPGDMQKYSRESHRVQDILRDFTPQVEFVGIDEGYLDVSGSLQLFGGKRRTAEMIRDRIEREVGLTASLGVAPNKLLAKIASDLEKPRGLVLVEPEETESFLRPLEVGRIPGVGPKMRATLQEMGIRTVGQLATVPRAQLRELFGEYGDDLYRKAHGISDSPVEPGGEAKSIGHEHTFDVDTNDRDFILATLMRLSEKVARRLRKAGKRGRTVTTKVRFQGFHTVTRRRTLDKPVVETNSIYDAAVRNLDAARVGARKLRLVGVTVGGLEDVHRPPGVRQTSLFGRKAAAAREDIRLRLARAEDAVKDKFGEKALKRGASMMAERARDASGKRDNGPSDRE